MAQNTHAATAGAGNQVVGKVVILYGVVKAISPDGAVRLLMPNSPIYANDRIVTESDGSVSIVFDGAQGNHLDLGRMTNVTIDHDVYAAVTPEDISDAATEVEQIQQALLTGDQPIELEAPAAGGPADAGGTHPIFVVAPTGAEVTPTSGLTTTGVTFGATGTIEAAAADVTPPVELNHRPFVDVAAAATFTEGAAHAGDVAFTFSGGDPDGSVTYQLTNNSNGYLAMGENHTIVLTQAGADAINNAVPISSLTAQVTVTEVGQEGLTASASAGTTVTDVDHGITLTPVGVSVNEANLPDGTNPSAASLTKTGSLTITALDGITNVQIGNTEISISKLHNLSTSSPISIDGVSYGHMTVTGFTETLTGGTIQYSFTLDDNVLTPSAESYVEQVSVSVTDADGTVQGGTLAITIADDHPVLTQLDHAVIANQDSGGAQILIGNHDLNFGADSSGAVINVEGDTLGGKLDYVYTTQADGSVVASAYTSTDHAAANHFFDLTVSTDGNYAFDLVNSRATYASGNISLLNVNGGAATNSFTLNNAIFNAVDVNGNHQIDKAEQLKPTSTGFGVANGNVDVGEQFNITFTNGVSVDTLSLYGKVQSVGSLKMSYMTDHLNADGTYDTGVVTFDTSGNVHVDPAHDFTSITFTVTSGSGKLDSFSYTERLIPNDETLHFQVSATDGDGDTTIPHALDVTLLGGHPTGTVIYGTSNSDAMIGTSGNDIFSTGGGHDTIMATHGNDHILDYNVNQDTLDISNLLANATRDNLQGTIDANNHLQVTVVDHSNTPIATVTFDGLDASTTSIDTLLDTIKTQH